MNRKLALALVVPALVAGLQSCIINASSKTSQTGKYVSNETFKQIQPGTQQEYVLALIGEPSTKTQLSDGTEIWRWTYRETKNSSGAVIFLINTDTQNESEKSSYVQMESGVVTKAWQD
jgi:outer membrane protein assembly factor BamE (lipoprotein component of BamABCDE complex)